MKSHNTEFMLAVCEQHIIERSFTKHHRQPKHWRGQSMCAKRNCYRDATEWLLIDLKDVLPDFIEGGISCLASVRVVG